MKLTPTEPPGRITRKAREFEAEIAQLRTQGYTLAAICRSLAAAGVQVSISTVRREVNRRAVPAPITPIRAPGPYPAAVQPTSPAVATVSIAAAVLSAGQSDPPSAKDLAEAFARSKSANPLVRAKEHP